VALANSDNGSTVTEGTSCPFIASSPTLRFDSLGFGKLALKIQEKGRNQSKSANKSNHNSLKQIIDLTHISGVHYPLTSNIGTVSSSL
jgi:hypothetical protein